MLYQIYDWQRTALGVPCDVIAPSLIPTKTGDRVKTDRKDAAQAIKAGEWAEPATGSSAVNSSPQRVQ